MIFGRPVEPPLVIAFQCGETASSSGSAEMRLVDRESGRAAPCGRAAATGSTPTTSFGSASCTIAPSSASGSRDETMPGTAPSFQSAKVVS